MNVVSFGGPPDSKRFVLAVHVSVLAKRKYPPFHFRTQPVSRERFQEWLEELCEDEGWDSRKLKGEALVTWYEIGCPGGPKVLLGGLYPLLEYLSSNYGVNREIHLSRLEEIVRLKKEEMDTFAKYDGLVESLKKRLVFSIVGAGSNCATSSIIYSLLRLKGIQIHDGIIIRLFDRFEHNYEKIKVIQKKFNILENKMGYGFVKIVKSFKDLLKDCDVLIFLGDNFRKDDMDVEKHLYKERVLWGVYGVLCNKYLPRRTKVVFAAMENPCFNATSFKDRGVSSKKLAVSTSYLANEIKSYISQVGGFPIENIVKIPVWGMVDMSHLLEVGKGNLMFRYPELGKPEFPNFEAIMEKCEPAMKLFVGLIMSRKEMRDSVKELSDTDKKINEKLNNILNYEIALREKLKYARIIQKMADNGDDSAMGILRFIWEEIIETIKEGKVNPPIDLKKIEEYCMNLDPRGSENKSVNKEINENEHSIRTSINLMNKVLNEDEDSNTDEENSSTDPKIESKLEMRNLEYLTSSLKHMWNFLGVAKNAVRKKVGQDPFISQIGELENLLQIWFLDPLRKKEVIYLGVISDGTYGFPEGVVLSQPASLNASREWEVYPGGTLPTLTSGTQKPYTLTSTLARARMCLKHFLIAPETETVEDLLERRFNNLDYVNWRLEKLQAQYEYDEMNTLDQKQTDDFAKEWLGRNWSRKLDQEEMEGENRENIGGDKNRTGGEVLEEEEASVSPQLEDYLHAEPIPPPERDEEHTQYLRDIGFYREEDVPSEGDNVLDSRYDELIKKAFMEYFCNEDLNSDNVPVQDECQREEDYYSQEMKSYEGIGMNINIEEQESYTSKTLEEPLEDVLPIRQGLGAALDIEDEFNYLRTIENPVTEVTHSNVPKIDEKHEYEKAHTMKPGFPLILQGKSTMDAYKLLLEMDSNLIQESFLSLANRIDEEYEEELSRGYTAEEEDGTAIMNESLEHEEKSIPSQFFNIQREWSTNGDEEFYEDQETISKEMIPETEPTRSFSTFTNNTTPPKSGDETPTFTIKDVPTKERERKEIHCRELWTEPEDKDPQAGLRPELSAVEKIAFLGALRSQTSENQMDRSKINDELSEEHENRNILAKELLASYKIEIEKKEYHFQCLGEEYIMNHNEIEQEIMKTENKIKQQSISFKEFVEKYRHNNTLYDIYEGNIEPEHHPFPKKMDSETYEEYKKRIQDHAQFLKISMERKKFREKNDREFFYSSDTT